MIKGRRFGFIVFILVLVLSIMACFSTTQVTQTSQPPSPTSPLPFSDFTTEPFPDGETMQATAVAQNSTEAINRANLEYRGITMWVDDYNDIYLAGEVFNGNSDPVEINAMLYPWQTKPVSWLQLPMPSHSWIMWNRTEVVPSL